MSKPIALPSPLARASRPAPTAPPAGPERTLQAPARAASAAGATPPEDCMTSGCGSPPPPPPRSSRVEVAAEQRREVGVDRGRRAALVLAEAGQDLVRCGDVDAGQLAPQVLGEPALVRGVEVGEEQADGDRLGAALADRRRQPRRLAVAERLDHALAGRPAPPPRSAARGRPAAPASARRGGRGGGGPGGRSRAGRRSRGSRPAPCGRRVPRAGRWSRPSSRGRRPRPRKAWHRPAPAPPRPRRSRPATGPPGSSAAWRCGSARRRRGRRR